MGHTVTPRQTITVYHPEHGETEVRAAMSKMDALMEAARRWGVQWSVILREVSFKVEEDKV